MRSSKKLVAGGMGEIYRAVRADGQYSKEVAVKLVRGGFDTSLVPKITQFRNAIWTASLQT